MGGVLLQNFQTLRVEARPMEMPAAFHIDISGLVDFEVTIQVGEVETSENVTILNDPNALVVRVTAPRIEAVDVEEDEGEEGLEGEEGEGEEGEGEEESEE